MTKFFCKILIIISFLAPAITIKSEDANAKNNKSENNKFSSKKKDDDDKKQYIRISDLDDLNAGIWNGESGDIELIDDICVYSTLGTYVVTAEGSAPSGKFRVYNADNRKKRIDFKVYWNDEAYNNSGEEELKKKKASITQTTTETKNKNCNRGTNLTARIRIVFDYDDLVSSRAGSYSGTLTLTIEPV